MNKLKVIEKEIKKQRKNYVKECQIKANLLAQLKEDPPETFQIEFRGYSRTTLTIKIFSFADLDKARAYLRKQLGSWTDEAQTPASSDTYVYVDYYGIKHTNFRINVADNKINLPLCFFKGGKCGWKTEVSQASIYENWACNI